MAGTAGASATAVGRTDAARSTARAARAAIALRRTVQRQAQPCLQLLAARLAARAGAVHIGDAAVGWTWRQRTWECVKERTTRSD